jgi:hypothetical protein
MLGLHKYRETYTQCDILLREIGIEIRTTPAIPSMQLSPPADLRRRPSFLSLSETLCSGVPPSQALHVRLVFFDFFNLS